MNSPNLEDFITAAREFCDLAESNGDLSESDLWKIRRVLLLLIFHISAVDSASQSPTSDSSRLDSDQYAAAVQKFHTLPVKAYRFVFTPHDLDRDGKSDITILSDDLADIYRDLSDGLHSLEHGNLEEACFDWSFSYKFHWSHHAVHALTAIETYRINEFKDAC